MGIRKRMRSRVKSIGSSQGVIGLRRSLLRGPGDTWHAPMNPERREIWNAECVYEIGRLLAWEQRMETRPWRKKRRER